MGGVFEHIEPNEIQDDLNSELGPVATLRLPNTNPNRDLCYNRQIYVEMFYDNTLQFAGMLLAGEASGSRAQWIKAYCHDAVMTTLDEAEPITGVYDEVPALDVLEEVIADVENMFGALNIDNCPTTPVTFVAYKANRLDIAKFLADSLGLELFSYGSNAISIGARGLHEWWPQRNDVTVGTHGFDKTKQATKVIIRGIDTFGRHITGEAALPYWVPVTRVRTFNEDTPTNQDGLEMLAAKKLIELNSGFTGAPVKIRMPLAKDYKTGDYLYVYNPKYFLFGNQSRIVSMTKGKTQASIQLDKLPASVAKSIDELRSWEKKGIYLPGCTSWSINLQDLVGFYHLNEGSGVVARDSSPRVDPQDGNIVNCAWQQNQYLKFLTFNGGSSYVDIGDTINFATTSKFSVGGWISPSVQDGNSRNIIHKDGQFTLKVVNGTIILIVYDSGGSPHTFTTSPIVTVGGRNFIIATYDGTTIRIYRNTKVALEQNISMSIHSSVNKVYIGMGFQGALGEVMLWQRCLYDQEVVELYFFPLVRTV
jgi:hypothetical protein